ncbi:uncharacterized protein ACA1_048120 [Acanthamoeba castellanii str. Neff]|uniref:Uncharacterized protein n=1 Tax=Acanthamoeba castellanii (strain ATCC 30010 / Neff) TaxID=1257118 RepID=L8GE84_ACACF|nr:uncharacterized protein ACA1_048120 [Acanthamoeba castellanii str. Neff]ELR11023.1 hypothetical protein ACA1_048120 [Acanthamoeba castellanii str. Neff]
MADADDNNKTGSPSSSYPPGGGQTSQAGGSHFFARGSGIRQAASLPTTSPLGFLRSAGKASASTSSVKPSAAQRMAGIESERGMRPPAAVEVRDMAAAGVRNSSRVLRRVESEKTMAVDDDDGVGSLQSSSSSTDLGYDDDMVGRRSVDAQMARNMLDTQLHDQFHTQKKNSLAYISFFKNAQKYSDSLQESAEYGAEMSQAMIKMTKTAPNSEEDSEIIESMAVSWGGMMQLQQHCLRPLFTEDEFAEKFQLYEGVAEVVSLEKEYKKQHAVYTQRLKRYEKSIRKERTKKAKQNSATLVSDSIDMQLLQTSFDEWRTQMMEDLTDMERVRQARFACLFWQNLERQLEHYRTFISLLEKEKNSWEARYRAVASTTPPAPAPAPAPSLAATTTTNTDATPLPAPLRQRGHPLRHLPAPPERGPDPFVEEVDHLLQGELDERQRKVTISAAVAQHKIKRPNSKRQSTIALASQLLDWCFQTDASMTAMPITRKTTASEGGTNNENENDNYRDNENDNGSHVDNDHDFEKEEQNNDDDDDKQPNNNNNNNHTNHDSNKLNPNNAESEGEPPLERQRLHSAADILDSIFAVDPPAHAPTTPASTAAGSSPALQASIGGSGLATQYRPSISGNKSQRVSIGCRRRSPSPAAAESNDSGPGEGGSIPDKGAERGHSS